MEGKKTVTTAWKRPQKKRPITDDTIVVVCSCCLRACCWQGEFMCDYAEGAGTVEKTVRELRADRHGESEEYWANDLS
jgi:hypothetical protein